MKLLTKGIEKALPEIESKWMEPDPDPTIVASFFTPWGNLTWYAVAGHRVTDDYIFWGFVQGFDDEEQWVFFTLLQLESIKGPSWGWGCLRVERDLHFRPTRLSELIKKRT